MVMGVTLDKSFVERIDALIAPMSSRLFGVGLDRSKIVRMLLERSIKDVETELGLQTNH